ncbi:unnamed protein product [Schistosoma intercalatum]|nr:unnamed protein product [Schistosoma intercalatum]CAH8523568.1 unnamed protein product [Schistosoma intercalatum]
MTTSDDIRSRMLHRADRLVNGIKNEEAWHLIGLFQQTHPNTFLQICHHTLASFLELTHDYFDDQRWPLISRLMLITNQKSIDNRRGRSRAAMNTNQNRNNIHEIFQSPIGSPLFMSNYQIDKLSYSSPIVSNVKLFNNTDEQLKNKLKPGHKRILKQLLPSMFPVPNNNNNNNNIIINNNGSKSSRVDLVTPTKKSDRSNSKTKLFFKQQVQPLFCKSGSNDTIRQFTCPFLLNRLNSSKIDDYLQQIKSKWRNDYTGYSIRYCNIDSTICSTLIDYMISNPKLCQTEGLFRIPGSALRIRELWLKLSHHFQNPYLRIPQPDPDVTNENLSPYPIIDHTEIYEILQSYTPHDISSLILRCLSTCTEFQRIHQVLNFDSTTVDSPIYSHGDQTRTNTNNPYSYDDGEYQQTGGLIPLEAGNLLFLATELQYKLKSTSSSSSITTLNNFDDNENIVHKLSDSQHDDWMYVLCQSRQLLAYRIVLQLLLPTPERYLLMSLLRLFKQIDDLSVMSKMTAECLSRCTAFAVFGAPLKIKKSHNPITITNRHHNHRRLKGDSNNDNSVYTFESYTNSITKRIDTLTNLIKMVHQLEDLPAIIYNTVRSRLRTHLGNSPIPRTASRLQCKSTTEKCNIESQYCLVDDRSMILKELTNVNHVQSEQFESTIQKRAKYQNDSDELIQSHPMNEMHLLSNSNRSSHIHRTKSTSNTISKNSLQQLKSNESQNNQLNNLHKTTKITTNNTTNNTSIDSFHLWKRHKPGTIHQEFKSSIINNTSFINSKIDNYDERFIKITNQCDVIPHSTPSSHHHHHHKTLIKSGSSSLLEESHIFN